MKDPSSSAAANQNPCLRVTGYRMDGWMNGLGFQVITAKYDSSEVKTMRMPIMEKYTRKNTVSYTHEILKKLVLLN